jgi:hypothetical protein
MLCKDVIVHISEYCNNGVILLRLAQVSRECNEALQENEIYLDFRRVSSCNPRSNQATLEAAFNLKAYHVLEYIANRDNICLRSANLVNSNFLRELVKYKPNLPELDKCRNPNNMTLDLLLCGSLELASKYINKHCSGYYLHKFLSIKEDLDVVYYLCNLNGCKPHEFSRIVALDISVESFNIIYRSLTRPIGILNVKDILNHPWSSQQLDKLERMFQRVGINIRRYYIDGITGDNINEATLLEMISRIPDRYYDDLQVEKAIRIQERKNLYLFD